MQYYKIEFTINKDGSVTERVIASGSDCIAVTQQLEVAMGEVRSQQLLPEYNEQANQQTQEETEDKTLWTSQ